MPDNVVDLESKRGNFQQKKKEAKVEALRRAFRLARGESESKTPRPWRKNKKKGK